MTTSDDIYPEVYSAEYTRLTGAGVSRVDAADQATRIAARAEVARRDAAATPRVHLNVRSDGTTYVEHDAETGTLIPFCRKCPDWQGEIVRYDPSSNVPGGALRRALLLTNKSTVWHAVEHGGAIPRPARSA